MDDMLFMCIVQSLANLSRRSAMEVRFRALDNKSGSHQESKHCVSAQPCSQKLVLLIT